LSSVSLSRSYPQRDLPSVPTRRSSDLQKFFLLNGGRLGRRFRQLLHAAGVEEPQRDLHAAFRGPNRSRDDVVEGGAMAGHASGVDRKSTRLNSSHVKISYAVFCLKKIR